VAREMTGSREERAATPAGKAPERAPTQTASAEIVHNSREQSSTSPSRSLSTHARVWISTKCPHQFSSRESVMHVAWSALARIRLIPAVRGVHVAPGIKNLTGERPSIESVSIGSNKQCSTLIPAASVVHEGLVDA